MSLPARFPPKCFSPGRAKGFERALHNPLAADVDPGTGRHLSIHR